MLLLCTGVLLLILWAARFCYRMVFYNVNDAKEDIYAIPPGKQYEAVSEQMIENIRQLQQLPYEQIYTDPNATSDAFSPAKPAMMIENSCVIVTGESLLQAFDRLEVMESTAHSIILSKEIGDIVHITDDEIEDLKTAFHLED